MILLILRPLMAALLALTGLSAEDETLADRGVIVVENPEQEENTPTVLPSPSPTG